jgi:hypothetical protein
MYLALFLVFGLATGAWADSLPYTDVDYKHWAALEAKVMYDKNFMRGVSYDHFAGDQPLTRFQFAEVLDRLLGSKPIPNSTILIISDVSPDSKEYKYINRVVQADVMTMDSGLFEGLRPVTRYEFADGVNRLLSFLHASPPEPREKKVSLKDIDKDHEQMVDKLTNTWQLTNGYPDGKFRGTNRITRYEALIMVAKAAALMYEDVKIELAKERPLPPIEAPWNNAVASVTPPIGVPPTGVPPTVTPPSSSVDNLDEIARLLNSSGPPASAKPSAPPTAKPLPTPVPTQRPVPTATPKATPAPTAKPQASSTPKSTSSGGSTIDELEALLGNATPKPSIKPTVKPSVKPTVKPSVKPTVAPATPKPTVLPTAKPSGSGNMDALNALFASATPGPALTPAPSAKPSVLPSPKLSAKPAVLPSPKLSAKPTVKPTPKPSTKPTVKPSAKPSAAASVKPLPQTSAKPASPLPSAKPSGTERPMPTPVPLPKQSSGDLSLSDLEAQLRNLSASPSPGASKAPSAAPTLKPAEPDTLVNIPLPSASPTVSQIAKASPSPVPSAPVKSATMPPPLRSRVMLLGTYKLLYDERVPSSVKEGLNMNDAEQTVSGSAGISAGLNTLIWFGEPSSALGKLGVALDLSSLSGFDYTSNVLSQNGSLSELINADLAVLYKVVATPQFELAAGLDGYYRSTSSSNDPRNHYFLAARSYIGAGLRLHMGYRIIEPLSLEFSLAPHYVMQDLSNIQLAGLPLNRWDTLINFMINWDMFSIGQSKVSLNLGYQGLLLFDLGSEASQIYHGVTFGTGYHF